MEDIVADDVVISDEEVIRTDAVTGAETRLTRFQVRTMRQLTSAEDALAGLDRDGVIFAVNSKSGRAALVVQGLTTTNDDDRLIPAVRLIRPEKRTIASLKGFEESAWEDAGEVAWRAAWEAEIAAADPWVSRDLVLVSGLLLPIWSSLPDKAHLGPAAEGAGRPALAWPGARSRPGPAAEGGLGPHRHRQRFC